MEENRYRDISMKQYRLNRSEHDRWRKNQQYFKVIESGQILRPLSIDEVKRYEESLASGVSPEVKVKGVQCTVVQERDLLLKEFIVQFGSVTLRRPNGKILKVARDPNVERPQYSSVITDTPSPSVCACRDLLPPHKGRHHPTCEYNQKALPEQRATAEDFARYRGGTSLEFADAPKEAEATFERPPVGQPAPPNNLPHPLECFCREWGNYNPAKGKQHNPACGHFDAWMKAHPSGFQLVSVKTEKPLRAATPEEVKKASLDMAHIIDIAGEKYMVIDYDKVDATGETDSSLEFELDAEVADTLPPPEGPSHTEDEEEDEDEEEADEEEDTVFIGPSTAATP